MLKDFPPLLTLQKDFGGLAGDATQDTYADSTVTDLVQPVAPTPPSVTAPASGVTISSISTAIDSDGHAHVDLAWAAVDGAASYEVRYKLTSESLYTYVTTATASIRISNLLPNTSYDFGVQAVGSGGITSGYGADTTQVTAADSSAPATVSGFSVSAGLKSVIASWSPNAEADLRDYKVEVATDAGFTAIVKTDYILATVYAYQGAAATTYYVRVKARDTSGNLSAAFASGNATTAQVVTGDVVPAAITTALIANAAITNALIANGAVDTAQLAALAVTNAKIGPSAVDNAQIAAAAVTGAKIAANTITASNILAGTITATEIAAATITGAKIAANTITAGNIAALTITAAEIAANTITAGKIAAGTITATEIAASTITGAKIAATTIAAGNIISGTITATQIATGTITADRMVAATITAASGILADAVITTAKIADANVTNAKIDTMVVDKLTAGSLSAAVILAGSIKSGTSGVRFEEDANGLRLYGYVYPRYRSTGAVANGVGNITPALPTGWAVDDIFVLFVESSNEVITAPSGWTEAPNSPQGTGTAATAASTRLGVFWRRAVGGDTAPTVTDTGDHTVGFIAAFSGCVTSGSPWDVTAGSVKSSTSTTGTIPGATTVTPQTLVVMALSEGANVGDDSFGGFFSAWLNTDLKDFTEIADYSEIGGTGGGIGVAVGAKNAAGTYGSATVTLASTAKNGYWTGALLPALGVVTNLNASTGLATYTGEITGAELFFPSDDTAISRGRITQILRAGSTTGGYGGYAMALQFYAPTKAAWTSAINLRDGLIEQYLVDNAGGVAVNNFYPTDFQLQLIDSANGWTAQADITLYGTNKIQLLGVTSMPQMPIVGSADTFTSGSSTRTNTAYGDLGAGAGPAVTVTIGASGMCFVGIDAAIASSAGNQAWISFAASGANTISAIDTYGYNTAAATFQQGGTKISLLTGLAAGSTTFTMKYKCATSGTITAANRHIIAIPI